MKKIECFFDIVMMIAFFVDAGYNFIMALILSPIFTITDLPEWEIFNSSISCGWYFLASFLCLLFGLMWELFALQNYDKIKENQNPRVA